MLLLLSTALLGLSLPVSPKREHVMSSSDGRVVPTGAVPGAEAPLTERQIRRRAERARAAERAAEQAREEAPTETSLRGAANQLLFEATDTESILRLTEADDELSAVNVATALHRLAVVNKRRRAGRDALLRDGRFLKLVDATIEQASEMSARGVSDVLWSYATLQHWPPTLLTPVLTALSNQLDSEAQLEGQHLSISVWALARLECKPTRLLERIELLAIPRLGNMNVQNCANLLWGFAKLKYPPSKLLPELEAALLSDDMLAAAKPVEVSDLAFALGSVGAPGAHDALLVALAERASPEGVLESFSSRQLVILIWAIARLRAADVLPEGRLDAWVASVRALHESTPLLVNDANNLERALGALGIDASWIKRSEMLNTWQLLTSGSGKRGRAYTDEDLRAAFDAIDTDKSGDIDIDELRAALAEANLAKDDAIVERMLAFGDVDGDMEVSFDEFKQIMTGEDGCTPA